MVLDLAILFGSSGKNSSMIFKAQQNFVTSMLDTLKVSPGSTLIGAGSYGPSPKVEWNIGSHNDKPSTVNAVRLLKNAGFNGDITDALKMVSDSILSVSQGARADVPKSILMFVDKNPIADKNELADLVQSFRERQIKLIVVGIARDEDRVDLESVSYDKQTVFFPPSLEELEKLVLPVSLAIRPGGCYLKKIRFM